MTLVPGMHVVVGPAYQMGKNPPYSETGKLVSDEHTGSEMTVVQIDGSDAALAPGHYNDPDSDDAVVWINVNRLQAKLQ